MNNGPAFFVATKVNEVKMEPAQKCCAQPTLFTPKCCLCATL